jgi:hypothetical protein
MIQTGASIRFDESLVELVEEELLDEGAAEFGTAAEAEVGLAGPAPAVRSKPHTVEGALAPTNGVTPGVVDVEPELPGTDVTDIFGPARGWGATGFDRDDEVDDDDDDDADDEDAEEELKWPAAKADEDDADEEEERTPRLCLSIVACERPQ